MYVMIVIDYDHMTDDFNDSLSLNTNRTINENSIGIIIPTLILKLPRGLSFLCMLSLMVYTVDKLLFNKK